VAKLLDHPNIIKTFGTVVEQDQAYLVMEYFDGTSLEQFCSFDRMLPVHRSVSIIFKCCLALDYAYRQGVIHRDIKPANILIDGDFNVKLTDLGLALNIGKKSDTDSTFIMGVGSPAYMSPEQIKGYPLNQKTDLYSLGVVLFHLLTGRLPFRAKNPAQLIYKIINQDPPSVWQLNPDVPERMDAILRKALEKDLYSRYRNGAEFAQDLSSVRFQILDDNYVPMDTGRYAALRKMAFFVEFEDVEIWEALRISSWRTVDRGTLLMQEGEQGKNFGGIIDGEVEVSIDGRRLAVLGPGEVFGESSYLDRFSSKRNATVVSVSRLTYLDINAAALALASEECIEHFQQRMVSILAQRFAQAGRQLAQLAEPSSIIGSVKSVALELALVDDTRPTPEPVDVPTGSWPVRPKASL
jgi:non-specific serine/threonine protein kinase